MSDRDALARLLFINRYPLAGADRARRWDLGMLVEHEPVDAYREADAVIAAADPVSLADVRAEAWDEGWLAHVEYADGKCDEMPDNPHRADEGNPGRVS